MDISFDTSLLLEENIGPNGLSRQQLENPDYSKAFEKVTANLVNHQYGFTTITENEDYIQKSKEVFEKISWAKHLVVIGIGGSDLGGRMLQQALQKKSAPMEVIFTGDTTDPQVYDDLLERVKLKDTVVNVVSKSGSTTETAVGYLLFKEALQKETGNDWTKHFVFTTDENEGLLRKEADAHSILTLPVPDNVGGRFSVLSPVGLLPALAMGADVHKLVQGAAVFAKLIATTPKEQNLSWQLALSNFLFQKEKGIDTVVLMPYIAKLELFAVWFRQLWAESLGKNGKGILPIKAIGPADQHSQVQFYNEGKWLSSFLFIAAKDYWPHLTVSSQNIEELAYLDKTSLSEVIKAECDATRFSLANNGLPSSYLEIAHIDEQHVGALIILFEIAVVFLAELLEVNAFDQPGVEAGKQYMYGLLGKKGFEEKAREIEEKKKAQVKREIRYQT